MPSSIQFGPMMMLCGHGARPYFPSYHFYLHPRGNTLEVGPDRNHHLGNPSAHQHLQKIIGLPLGKARLGHALSQDSILIHSESLVWPSACKAVLKAYNALRRSPAVRYVQLIFLVSEPQKMLQDNGFLHLEEQFGGDKLPVCFPYWPRMPMLLYADLFGLVHPDSSAEERLAESLRLRDQACQAAMNNQYDEAHYLLHRAESWYKAAEFRRRP